MTSRNTVQCPTVRARRRSGAGFSLVEMSVVLLIVTLLLGSVLVPLSAQVDERKFSETSKQLDQIKEALIGFALANGYLPCPAISSTNGLEDRTGTTCTGGKRSGFLPWTTLGIAPSDAWDDLYGYSVTPAFTNSNPISVFTLSSVGDITIQTRDNLGNVVNLSNAGSIPAVVISFGKNGYGATGRGGIPRVIPAGWAGDEQVDYTSATTAAACTAPYAATPCFVWRVRTDNAGASGGVYDDLVVWITPGILFSRMVAAGRLP
ncbi:MAG TPA: prepilin-type N-terminal cleavage/methylation domain-containing protein [Burkholderiales bacterium]|nr:prepilin-type N-terminal cleavage/methylation domain-containing protein [Burkholderiales bacterium]